MKCPHCEKEIAEEGWLAIPELGIEVEIEVHDKGTSYTDAIKLLKEGERFLSVCREKDNINEVVFLVNKEKYSKLLKMDGSSSKDDFYIEQPFNLNKQKGLVAGFYVDSDIANLYCWYDASYSYSYLGVRKCRDLKGRGEAKKK